MQSTQTQFQIEQDYEFLSQQITKKLSSLNQIQFTKSNWSTSFKELNIINQMISSMSMKLSEICLSSNNNKNININTNIPSINDKYNELTHFRQSVIEIKNKLNLLLLKDMDDTTKNNTFINNRARYNEPVDVNLITDYHESLLHESIINLNRVNENLKETDSALKNQGTTINEINTKMDKGYDAVKNHTKLLNEVESSKKCKKLWMFIVNVLMFLVIILLLLWRLFNIFK